jgi:hypothetical protein
MSKTPNRDRIALAAVEKQLAEKEYEYLGKRYHWNEETGRWHDRNGNPVNNSGIRDELNKLAGR